MVEEEGEGEEEEGRGKGRRRGWKREKGKRVGMRYI